MSNPRKKRQPRRVTASGVPATRSSRHVPSIDERDGLDIVIRQAMDNIELASTPGTKSSAWGIDRDLLIEMCESNIINKVPVQHVLENFAGVIEDAAATPRCVARFIERVRIESNRIRTKAWKQVKAEKKLAGLSDDPLATAMLLLDRMSLEAMAGLESGDLTAGTVGERHALIRSIEVTVQAIDKFAAARAKNARADHIIASINKLAERLEGEAKKGTKTISIQQIADEVRAAAGGAPKAA